jgi:signal transduction histidine kinase
MTVSRAARFVAVSVLLACCALDSVALARQQKEVLVLYATRRDAQIVAVGDRELPAAIERGIGGGLDYYSEFLDQARVSQLEYQAAFSEFLKVKYQGQRFDLLIAMGEVPLRFLSARRPQIFGDVPIVFFSDRLVERPSNATGILSEANFGDTVTLASALQPGARDVYVISGTSPNDERLLELAKTQFRTFEPTLTFHYLSRLPASELLQHLSSISPNSIVYYLLFDRDGAGINVHPLEFVDRVTAASAAPVYSWVDSVIGRGVVGGSLKEQEKQAQAVSGLAVRVLQGESADRITVATPDLNTRQVDWRQLQRWGISESRVPVGTVVHFKVPTAWEQYRGWIIAAVAAMLAQSVLIAMQLVQRRRRLQAEAKLIKQQDELQQSYDRIRDLGARLLNAQERERARIARELHDDISQRMAVLGIDLKMLSSSLDGKAADITSGVVARTQEITRSIHDLAHQLHPARLHLLGLVGALRGLERELSRPGLAITLTHDEIPPLSPELTLCLFRIVQEALQNAIKYSQAHEVAVALNRVNGSGVRLTITDDGVGFNVDGTWNRGLGLISMRERLEAVGGTLSIFSKPGYGTRLVASAPLAQQPRENAG